MGKEIKATKPDNIENLIYSVRGLHVMTDRDLAEMYQVETRALNQAVKRNKDRFPEAFMFQLTGYEFEDWKSQIVMSNKDKMGLRRPPFVFTEQGVAMLSAVLTSKIAVQVSIQIISAFVEMRKIINTHAGLLNRMDKIELTVGAQGQKIDKVFKAMEAGTLDTQGVFCNGETFDAYVFVAKVIRSAKLSIRLVDNYIDDSVLTLLTKRKAGIPATIYTKNISKALSLDLEKHNSQYEPIEIVIFDKSHDRFMIIDDSKVYHLGASIKDLGKKWFAFTELSQDAVTIINKLREV